VLGREGWGGGQREEMAQIMYVHRDKLIKKRRLIYKIEGYYFLIDKAHCAFFTLCA
jgi:hypothetical protein